MSSGGSWRDLAAATCRPPSSSWFCAHAARAHPFLSRKGCKSDPRGAPLGYPPDGARCFPGSMGGDFSPNPGGQHHWIPPGCSEKSSASAETAHTPAVAGAPWALFATLFALPAAPTGAGRSRPRFYLRHCRVTRECVSNDATARCPPPGGGAPAESKTRSWFYLRHCRVARE